MAVLQAPQIPTNGTDAPQAAAVLIDELAPSNVIVMSSPLLAAPATSGVAADSVGYATTG